MSAPDNAKQMLLQTLEKALLRSPFYDERSRDEAMRQFREALCGPALDDVGASMSPDRAEFVRRLRIDEQHSFRGVAAACAEAWGVNWGSNQLVGEDLCRAAAEALGIPQERFF